MKKIVSLFTLLLTTLASWAIDDGVPHALAQQRSREITNVSYLLRLHIPAERAQMVTGKATVLFHWAGKGDLVLDFTGSLTGQPSVNGRSFPKARVEQEHIVIPKRLLRKGANRVNWRLRVATPPSTATTTISIRSLSQPMRVASSPVSTSPTSRPFSRSSSLSPRGGTMSRVPTPSILSPPTFSPLPRVSFSARRPPSTAGQ